MDITGEILVGLVITFYLAYVLFHVSGELMHGVMKWAKHAIEMFRMVNSHSGDLHVNRKMDMRTHMKHKAHPEAHHVQYNNYADRHMLIF